LIVGFRGGVSISDARVELLLDAAENSGRGQALRLVSHAHADHVQTAYEEHVVTTPDTRRLISTLRSPAETYVLRNHGEYVVPAEGISVRLMDAGHVVGSAQFLVETEAGAVLYTGDINTYETLTSKPAEVAEADTLIIESTYGDQSYIFPERETVYADIVKWITKCARNGAIPAFKAYPLGKSQELIRLVNLYTKLPVVVGPAVDKTSQICREAGLKLEFVSANSDDGRALLSSGGCVYLDSFKRHVASRRRLRWAIATGWALRERFDYFEAAFPLSSHADFRGPVSVVEQVKPRKVYVIHGFTANLARSLRGMGYDARPAETIPKKPRQLVFE